MTDKNIVKGKLTAILSGFTKKDIRLFDDFVRSPFFNKNKRIIAVWKLIKKHYPCFNKLYKHQLFRIAFPDKKKYNDLALRSLLSDVTQLLLRFLAQVQFNKHETVQKQWILLELLERNLYEIFEKTYRPISENWSRKLPYNEEYYLNLFNLQDIAYQYTSMSNNRSQQANLQEVINHLDLHYLTTKLRYAAIALNRRNVVRVEYDLGYFWNEIETLFATTSFNEAPLVKIYYSITKMLIHLEKDEYFQALKSLLEIHKSRFSTDELRQIYVILINYCTWKTTMQKSEYIQEAFTIYRSMVEDGILFVGEYISPHHFKNIVAVSISAKQFEWANNFMQSYKTKVEPPYQENVYLYNMGYLYFATHNFEKAAEVLMQIQFSDFEFIDLFYQLGYRTLLVKTLYENKEWLPLHDAMEAFRQFLMRNQQINTTRKEAYMNFVKILKKILNRLEAKKGTAINLLTDVSSTSPLVQQSWLINKIQDLE